MKAMKTSQRHYYSTPVVRGLQRCIAPRGPQQSASQVRNHVSWSADNSLAPRRELLHPVRLLSSQTNSTGAGSDSDSDTSTTSGHDTTPKMEHGGKNSDAARMTTSSTPLQSNFFHMDQLSNSILAAPTGTLSAVDLLSAEKAIQFYCSSWKGASSIVDIDTLRPKEKHRPLQSTHNSAGGDAIMAGIDRAGQLLERLVEERLLSQKTSSDGTKDESSDYPYSGSDALSSNVSLVFNVWRQIPGRLCFTNRSVDLLRQLEGLEDFESWDHVVMLYGMVLDGLAKMGQAEQALEILNRMHESRRPNARPNTVIYNTVMNALANAAAQDSSAAEQAEALLERMHVLQDVGNVDVIPSAMSYSIVIHAWAQSRQGAVAANHVEALLRDMRERSKAGNVHVHPDAAIYTGVLDAFSKNVKLNDEKTAKRMFHLLRGDDMDESSTDNLEERAAFINEMAQEQGAPQQAEAFLRVMKAAYEKSGDVSMRPNVVTFTSVIDAWSKSKSRDAPQRAEALKDEMIYMYESGAYPDVKPSRVTYNALINTWAKSQERGAAQNAERVLNEMIERFDAGDTDLQPNAISYTSVVEAYAQSRDKGSIDKAERIIRHMEQLYDAGNVSVKPNATTYVQLIYGLSRSPERNAARRAEAVLQRMQEMYDSGNVDVRPNRVAYNTVLNALAHSHEPGSVARADKLLEKMQNLHIAGDNSVSPDAISWATLMNAYAHSRDKNAPHRCEALLKKLQEAYRLGQSTVKPDSIIFNTVQKAWIKSEHPDAGKRCEAILEQMHELYLSGDKDAMPTVASFNSVLAALSKSSDKGAPERAEAILQHMEDLRASGTIDIKPDLISFSTVINVWTKSRLKGSALRAEAILQRMQELYEEGSTHLKPNTITFSTVIHAWAVSREPEAPERAENILDQMHKLAKEGNSDVRPNTITYNTVINAWSKSKGDPETALARAEILLERMHELYNSGNFPDIKPSTVTYNATLSCIRKCKNERRSKAAALLHQMEKLHGQNALFVKPNSITYATYLSILAIERVSASQAEAFLKKTIDMYNAGDEGASPNQYAYESVLRACAYTRSKDRTVQRTALRVAINTLTALREASSSSSAIYPNIESYVQFLRACSSLTQGDELIRLMTKGFEYCCEDGLVTEDVLITLVQALPKVVVCQILKQDPAQNLSLTSIIENLPTEWTRHEKRKPPKFYLSSREMSKSHNKIQDRTHRTRSLG
eukprot:scaffold121532_cov61-Attheya_sp.AAC.1